MNSVPQFPAKTYVITMWPHFHVARFEDGAEMGVRIAINSIGRVQIYDEDDCPEHVPVFFPTLGNGCFIPINSLMLLDDWFEERKQVKYFGGAIADGK